MALPKLQLTTLSPLPVSSLFSPPLPETPQHVVRGTVPAPTAIASCPGIPFPANPPLILFMQVSARVLQLREKKSLRGENHSRTGFWPAASSFSIKLHCKTKATIIHSWEGKGNFTRNIRRWKEIHNAMDEKLLLFLFTREGCY